MIILNLYIYSQTYFFKRKWKYFWLNFFSEEKNIIKIIIISIYLFENVVKKIKEISNYNKIKLKSIYYGEKLDYYFFWKKFRMWKYSFFRK